MRAERPSAGSLRPSEVARSLQQGAQRPLWGWLVAFLFLAGCAGEQVRSPARLGEPRGVVVERGGVPSRVVACDQGTAYVFESGDGVHWREASSGSVAFALLEAAPGWAVSRDYDSTDAGATPFRLWRADGMNWREVATLRASSSEASVGE